MIESEDQTGRKVILNDYPSAIVSVVPSQTELLFDLGLEDKIAGVTKFCVHPAKALNTKTIVGGTKNLNIEKIRSLNPDLILANKEENTREQIEILLSEFPVWVSDVKTLADAKTMINRIGEITGVQNLAKNLTDKISSAFTWLQTSNLRPYVNTCAYLIWHKPMMTIGGDTFIHCLMKLAGFENIFADRKRYPEISEADLVNADPEIIMLSSEPFPFCENHFKYYRSVCPKAKIIIVDGQMFSWYGSRLRYAPEYFLNLYQSI